MIVLEGKDSLAGMCIPDFAILLLESANGYATFTYAVKSADAVAAVLASGESRAW